MPSPGLLFRCLGLVLGNRPADGRLDRAVRALAMDFLAEHSVRPDLDTARGLFPPRASANQAASHRLPRCSTVLRRAVHPDAGANAKQRLGWRFASRIVCRRWRIAAAVHCAGAPRSRTDDAAEPVATAADSRR